jgi:phage-related protein
MRRRLRFQSRDQSACVPHVVHQLTVKHEPSDPALGLKNNRGSLFSDPCWRRACTRVVEIAKPDRGSETSRRRYQTVDFGWPIGMPVCRPLGDGLYEVRSSLTQNRIARVLFYIDARGRMVLLDGFIKKTQKTPPADLELARKNKALHESELKREK